MNIEEIGELERVADLAYPAERVASLDGWLLRSGGDLGRRVNSAAPLETGSIPLAEKVDRVEAWYRDRGRPPIFKLTAAARPPGLDAFLAGRGYREDAAVVVMTCPIEAEQAGPTGVEVDDAATRAWREALGAFSGKSAGRVAGLPGLIARAPGPAAYVSLAEAGSIAGVSLGVVVEGHLGVFEVFVDPARRRRGTGRRMMEALVGWGAARGARSAFLQVEERNTGARRFYRVLGFTDAYRYWYRVRD